MQRHSFLDDYSDGCHAQILTALSATNMTQQTAYGEDEYCIEARQLIQARLGGVEADVHFVASGTLANIISIASALRPHEAVIAAVSGHIAMRETGAIEATGHKIITMPSADGKLTSDDVRAALQNNAHAPHMAKPRLVYISNATEFGTVYTKAEMQSLSATCKENGLLFLIDGARLGAALSADINDLSLAELAMLSDIFWIGGTKAGALVGEAIVVCNPQLKDDFSFHIKQRGALLAKGRLLGIQFVELFRDNLYFDATKHANGMATKLSGGLTVHGYSLAAATESNQVFPILPNTVIDRLREQFDFHVWSVVDEEHSVIRVVMSWATPESSVDAFIVAAG
ncbi:MAG: aminotransferase class V-fold PLP-dependent enzyme [Chromatiales bacterium]|jgi:threonine aldolase|nr:aminotransferase class V-fold PLP-dependent enzyme [Chromatiales bacterium]